MFEELTPPEKVSKHNAFVKYCYIAISWLGSTFYLNILLTGAIFYHLRDLITGREKFNEPIPQGPSNGYMARKPYPNLRRMKPKKDLRYFALQMGLDLEEYSIVTKDGYCLPLHRLIIVGDKERDHKKPILLQHGLLSSSGCWITGGYNSLAYYFIEMGYDVWLGNNRSNFEPKHKNYNGNLMNNEKYWDWDIRELAYYDLPCIIENVLSHKPNHEKLVYVGHSQGCTQSFLMLKNGNLKQYHDKIEYYIGLAPAIFPGKLFHERKFIKFLHGLGPTGFKLFFGPCSFLRIMIFFRNTFARTRMYEKLAYMLFKYLFGWTGKKWDQSKRIWHFHFIFNCSYVSAKLFTWWTGYYREDGFASALLPYEDYKSDAHYKYNPSVKAQPDSKQYFAFGNSWFEPTQVTIPMLIFTGDLDYLVDGYRLLTHMKHYEPGYVEGVNFDHVELDDHSHLDVVWAEDVIGRIGKVIHDKLSLDSDKNESTQVNEKLHQKLTKKVCDQELQSSNIEMNESIITPESIQPASQNVTVTA